MIGVNVCCIESRRSTEGSPIRGHVNENVVRRKQLSRTREFSSVYIDGYACKTTHNAYPGRDSVLPWGATNVTEVVRLYRNVPSVWFVNVTRAARTQPIVIYHTEYRRSALCVGLRCTVNFPNALT